MTTMYAAPFPESPWKRNQPVPLTQPPAYRPPSPTLLEMQRMVRAELDRLDRNQHKCEVRKNDDGTVDEVIVTAPSGRCIVHVEQLHEGVWCLIVGDGENRLNVSLSDVGIIVEEPT